MNTLEEIKQYFADDKFATLQAGAEILEASDQHSLVTLEVKDYHKNARGGVMGGAIYTLADFAFAVATNCGGNATVTVTASISYLKPVKGTKLFAKAKAIKEGRSMVFYEIAVTDDLGTDVAIMNVTGTHV